MAAKSQSWDILRFFDKTGSNLNLSKNSSNIWTGNIHLPKLSVGILENQHLFILEQLFHTITSKIVWGQPQNKNSNTDPSKFNIYFENNDEKFFVYTVQVLEPNPVIVKANSIDIYLDKNVWTTTTISGGKHYKNVSSYINQALQLNICFSSSLEEIVENKLVIDFIPDSLSPAERVAEIDFRAETIEEDERFRLNLENFGRVVDAKDALIFRDTDINEPKPNWIKINEKRKELLLEGHNIYPYIGSYKGLINAINFFGYQDLTIKEYWLNIDVTSSNYGKITQIEIPKIFTPKNPHQELIDNTKFRKTQQFGLFYNINEEVEGEEDEFGFPIVKETFMFTNEEVLIKLFALREKLKKEYLPLNARIVDITGEGVYFEKFKMKSWLDQTIINRFDFGNDKLDFTAKPGITWIDDLRGNSDHICPGPTNVSVENTPNLIVHTIGNCLVSYFDYINDRLLEDRLADDIGIPAGAKIVLDTQSLNVSWDDLDMSWNNLEGETGLLYTWDNIGFGSDYELEWVIQKQTDQKYFYKIRGPVTTLKTYTHYLPFVGLYDITLNVYDLFNGISMKVKDDVVEVVSYTADFSIFTRMLDQENIIWNNIKFDWEHLTSSWDLAIQNTTVFDDAELTYDDLNFAKYRFQDEWTWDYYTDPWKFVTETWDERLDDLKRYGTRCLTWNNFDTNIMDELWHQTWDMYDYQGDHRGGWLISTYDLPQSENPVPGWYYTASGSFTIPNTGFDIGDEFEINGTLIREGIEYILGANDQQTASHICTAINTLIIQVTASHNYSTNTNGDGIITIKAKVTGSTGNAISITVLSGNAIASGSTLSNAGVVPSNVILGIDNNTEIWLDFIGNGYPFKFSSTINPNDWVQGAIELNASTMNGIKDFHYVARPLNDPTHIHAVAKHDGRKGQKTFVINRLVAQVTTIIYTKSETIDTGVIDGSFNYNDIWSFQNETIIPTCTPLFLSYSRSKIPGKSNPIWKIYNELTKELISTINNEYLIWNFNREGMYSIELQLTDSNNNIITNYKKGVIKTYKRELNII